MTNTFTMTEQEMFLWKLVEGAFLHHRCSTFGDNTGLDAANRVFEKVICRKARREYPPPPLHPKCCTIRSEIWPSGKLATLVLGREEGDYPPPNYEDGPVVVVEWRGKFFVIDGNRRVKKWLLEGDHTDREVIIIRPAVGN